MSDQPLRLSLRTAPHGRSWPHYLFGIALNAVFFMLVGPLVGGLLIGSVAFAWPAAPIAYGINGYSAALAGAILAIASSFVPRPATFFPLAALVGAATAGIFGHFLVAPAKEGNAAIAALAMTGAIVAMLCALLGRSLRLHPTNRFIARPEEKAA